MFCFDFTTILIGNMAHDNLCTVASTLNQNSIPFTICDSSYAAAAKIINSDKSQHFLLIGCVFELSIEDGNLFEITSNIDRIKICCYVPQFCNAIEDRLSALDQRGVHIAPQPHAILKLLTGMKDNSTLAATKGLQNDNTFQQKMNRLAEKFFISHHEKDALKRFV